MLTGSNKIRILQRILQIHYKRNIHMAVQRCKPHVVQFIIRWILLDKKALSSNLEYFLILRFALSERRSGKLVQFWRKYKSYLIVSVLL